MTRKMVNGCIYTAGGIAKKALFSICAHPYLDAQKFCINCIQDTSRVDNLKMKV